MTLSIRLAIGCACLAISIAYPHISQAEGFKNRDFLAMPDVQKKFWLSGSISTLGHVALVKSRNQSQCVYDWYFKSTAKRNGLILASMQKYPDHTPSAIVIVLLEKACGKFVQER